MNGKIIIIFTDLMEQELKCDEVSFVLDPNKNSTLSTYVCDTVIDDRTFSIFADGTTAYIFEGVEKEDIVPGLEVRLSTRVVDHKEQIRAVEKYEWFRTNTQEAFNKEEEWKTEIFVNKAERYLRSKECSYQINEKISTRELYHALYSKLPQVLPEFGFVRRGNAYISTTGYKLDGSCGQKDKVYIYENNPGMLVDYTRGNQTIWEYIARSEHLTDKSKIFEYIAAISGLKHSFEKHISVLKESSKAEANKFVISEPIAREVSVKNEARIEQVEERWQNGSVRDRVQEEAIL
ncbi:hypothetical protein MIDIC_10006 [Alphaproteobacteria bacterium]